MHPYYKASVKPEHLVGISPQARAAFDSPSPPQAITDEPLDAVGHVYGITGHPTTAGGLASGGSTGARASTVGGASSVSFSNIH